MQFDTAISVGNVAEAAESDGDLDTAARLFERSVQLRRRIVERDPSDVRAPERLGYALVRAAGVHRLRRDFPRALTAAREAVRVGEGVFDRTGDRAARQTLLYACVELGRVEALMRDRASACRAFGRAREIAGAPAALPREFDRQLAQEAAREAEKCDSGRQSAHR